MQRRAALSDKYDELVALKRSREVLEAQGIFRLVGEAGRARQAKAREVAHRFPGALRELEELSLSQLVARLDVARAVEQGERQAPLWLRVVRDYHEELREALAIKAYLAKADATDLAAFIAWFLHCPERTTASAHVTASFVSEHLRPPDGRLSRLVLRRLQRRYGLSAEDLSNMLYRAT